MSRREQHPTAPEHHRVSSGPLPLWLSLFIRHFPRRDFVVGGLIPLLLFTALSRQGQPLAGILVAGSWGLGLTLFDWWRTRRVQGFAVLAVIFAAIQLVTTLITRNPGFFLFAGVINAAVEELVYFASLLFPRSLIQIAAEAMGATAGIPEELRNSPAYPAAWQRLTAIWGAVTLAKGLGLALARDLLPLEASLLLGLLLGWPLQIALLAFSFWFPGWYWSRQRTGTAEHA